MTIPYVYGTARRVPCNATGEPAYSLSSSIINFTVKSGDITLQLRIRLARKSTPGCCTRDPLLQLKCGGIKKVLKLEEIDCLLNCIESFLNNLQYQPVPETIRRKVCVVSGEMSLNERFNLLPKFEKCIAGQFDYQVEYRHPQGRVDVCCKSDGKVIFVELKYVNENETPLAKLRMATGQILMYANDPKLQETVDELWVVLNRGLVNEHAAVLAACSKVTKIKYFAVVKNKGRYHLERLDTCN